jgi:hypothetical protein
MILINHDKKAIFIHIPKTGGLYVEAILNHYYGFINYGLFNLLRPDHNLICKNNDNSKHKTVCNKEIGFLKYVKTSDYLNSYIDMTHEKWNKYTKFTFIRNPYDRIVSGWNYCNKLTGKNEEFEEVLNKSIEDIGDIGYTHIFMEQYKHIIDENDECFIDIIGRTEYLDEDLNKILEYIGFTILHKPNKNINKFNHEPTNSIINSQELLNKVNNICINDLELFHYKKIHNINLL